MGRDSVLPQLWAEFVMVLASVALALPFLAAYVGLTLLTLLI